MGDAAVLLLAALACVMKVAQAAGAPRGLLLAFVAGAGAAAVALAFAPGRDRRWLDPSRLVLVLVALASLLVVYPRLGGDGYQYYVLLRSPVFDHDLDFANDFESFGVPPATTLSGQITSRMPIGTALVWAPAVLATHVAVRVANGLGAAIPADGFSPPYQAAATVTTFALVVAALILLERVLRPRYGRGPALLAVLGVWLATPLQFYATANAFMSHGASAFAATAFVLAWLRARETTETEPWLLTGFFGGLMCLIRPQDAVLIAPAALELLVRGREGRRPLGALVAWPILMGVVQIAVWLRMYGLGFARVVSDQSYVGHTSVHALDVLFSARHGLFPWTPIAIAAVLGWIGLARRQPRLAALFALAFALAVIANGAMQDWWGSDSFGQRRLLALTPLLAFGLAEAFAFFERRPLVLAAGVLAAFVLWNDQLAFLYNTQRLAPKTQAITLDRLAAAEVDLVYEKVERWKDRLPARVWLFAYENLKGVWLDEGARSLGGAVDIGGTESPELAVVIGPGWGQPLAEGEVGFRRSRGLVSSLSVPIRTPAPFGMIVRARSAREDGVTTDVRVNGRTVASLTVHPGWDNYAIELPADALRPGFNSVELSYAPGGGVRERERSVDVDWVRFERRGATIGPT